MRSTRRKWRERHFGVCDGDVATLSEAQWQQWRAIRLRVAKTTCHFAQGTNKSVTLDLKSFLEDLRVASAGACARVSDVEMFCPKP